MSSYFKIGWRGFGFNGGSEPLPRGRLFHPISDIYLNHVTHGCHTSNEKESNTSLSYLIVISLILLFYTDLKLIKSDYLLIIFHST